LSLTVDTFSRYDFSTGDPRAVVRAAVVAAGELLDEAEDARVGVIEQLTQGRSAEGLAAPGKCCGAWRQVHSTISGALQLLKVDPASLRFEGRSAPESLADSKPPLNQIKAALDAHDFVLVSDVLQYEFEPVIQNWRSFMVALQEAATA
jgi:hypothetical protein